MNKRAYLQRLAKREYFVAHHIESFLLFNFGHDRRVKIEEVVSQVKVEDVRLLGEETNVQLLSCEGKPRMRTSESCHMTKKKQKKKQ